MTYSATTLDKSASQNSIDETIEQVSSHGKRRSLRSKKRSLSPVRLNASLPRKTTTRGKLILIRHGHTSLNQAGEAERLRGWLDVPLDEVGLQEAEQTAARISGHGIAAIYSSDLTRAIQTSVSVSRATGAPVIPTGNLRPWNLGSFAGQLVKELIPFLDLLKKNPELPAPGGESWNEFYERYSRQLLTLMAQAADSGKTIAAVTHVRNFLAAPTVVKGGDRNKIASSGGPKTGSTFIIERINGRWSMNAEA
jgi:broad specificity phosphatase PhoE